jgi:hypothetical protein
MKADRKLCWAPSLNDLIAAGHVDQGGCFGASKLTLDRGISRSGAPTADGPKIFHTAPPPARIALPEGISTIEARTFQAIATYYEPTKKCVVRSKVSRVWYL